MNMGLSGQDILIAGGGLVGLAAGLALQSAGFAVRVLDQAAPPPAPAAASDDVRVYALSPASLHFLQTLGVALPPEHCAPYTRMQVWETAPEQALTFHAPAPDAELGVMVEHRYLAHALAQAVMATQLPVQWQTAITGVQTEEGAVQLNTDPAHSLDARLLVVCDGPRSTLRQRLDVPVVQRDYDQRAIVATVMPDRPHQGIAWQRFLPSGPLALLPRADGAFALVWSCDSAFADALLDLPPAAFEAALNADSQQAAGALRLCSPCKAIPLHLLHPQAITGPGFVLAGDAAHVVHPLAGQGLNLGFADAEQLAATLAAAKSDGRGWWRARTLARYAGARQAEAREMMVLTDGLQRLFGSSQAAFAALRHHGLRAVQNAGPLKGWLTAQATRL